MPTRTMLGRGTGAATDEMVLASSPPAPPSADLRIISPEPTLGPAAGMTGLRKV
ncbi:MAG: hypothetical protein GYA12_15265 [Chloroflexi bacterium]|nr:hypothetical protein [Chloroflexota bacterium]